MGVLVRHQLLPHRLFGKGFSSSFTDICTSWWLSVSFGQLMVHLQCESGCMLRFEHIVCNGSRHLEADLRVFTGVSSGRGSVSSKVVTAAVGVSGEFVEEAVKIVGSGSGVTIRSVEGPACSLFNFVRQLRHTHDSSMRSSPNTFWINSFLS